MKNTLLLASSIAGLVLSSRQISAQDLSTYRDFHMGMSLAEVAKQAEIAPEASRDPGAPRADPGADVAAATVARINAR